MLTPTNHMVLCAVAEGKTELRDTTHSILTDSRETVLCIRDAPRLILDPETGYSNCGYNTRLNFIKQAIAKVPAI
jgi:hypothetical protein